MIRFILATAIAFGYLTAFCPTTTADSPPSPYNASSHTAEFFEDLLAGRVFVYQYRGTPAAAYFHTNGHRVRCSFDKTRNRYIRSYPDAEWTVSKTTGQRRLIMTNGLFGSRHKRFSRVAIYTPTTGRFHLERFNKNTALWEFVADGWIQDQWPRILLQHCPELALPYDVPINEHQTSIRFADVKANATPIRNHPGSDITFPGATGVAASNNQPTMTLQEVEAIFQRLDRHIAKRARPGWLTFVPRPEHREIWMLDEHDNVTDVAIMRLIANGTIIHVKWEKSGLSGKLLVGYPLPAIPTDRPHPVFAMMDKLTTSRKPVALPSITTKPDPHVFASAGTVRTPHSTGIWHISRGAVHVDIDGTKRAYPWRDFAERAGWSN